MEVHKGIYWYSAEQQSTANLIPVPVERVLEIQALNKNGIKPEKLMPGQESTETALVTEDLLKENSLTRFDTSINKNNHKKNPNQRKNRRFHDKRKK
jgi:hypothetical protein